MSYKICAYVHAYVGMGRNAGAETTLHDMLKFLVVKGWEASVIVSQPLPGMKEYVIDGVNVIPQIDKRTILHWIPRSDIVISHLECSERATMLCQKYKIPSIQLIHNDMDVTKGYVALGPDIAVFNTEWVRDSFSTRGTSIVVHPPVSSSDYASDLAKREFVTLVNLWPNKGSNTFYECAKRLPDVKFLGVRGGYGEQDVRDLQNVTIVDNTSAMAAVYARTKLILMPSAYESYGRVAVEAMSQGIPSIVADTPGLREALGPAGTFVDPSNIDSYVSEISRLMKPRAWGSAKKLCLERFSELELRTKDELSKFEISARTIADVGKMVRGW
jgi:glycosyltransferase involved in cell wall biosynthesis